MYTKTMQTAERRFLTQIDEESDEQSISIVAEHIKTTLERAGIQVIRE